jgi:hypothetical protein
MRFSARTARNGHGGGGRPSVDAAGAAANDQGAHLPTVKVGVQKLSGQKRTEMKYCAQLWSDARLPAVVGKCGDAVLRKIPIRMYTTMKRPILLKRVLKKFTPADPSFWCKLKTARSSYSRVVSFLLLPGGLSRPG